MGQMEVNPPAAAAREPLSMVSAVLEARLAQVHVHVDEAGRHDQPGGVEHFRVRRATGSAPTPAITPSSIQTSATRVVPATRDRSRVRS